MSFDEAWSKDQSLGGVRIVVRDDAGIFVATTCRNFHDVISPLHAEALTARELTMWAATKGLTNLLIEGDSLQIIGALSDPSPNCSVLG